MTFQAYLDTIMKKTGLGPEEFLELARERDLLGDGVKAGPVIEWLKADYGLGQGHAMALISTFRAATQPSLDKGERIARQFAGARAVWQLAYDELMASVMHFGHDVSVVPTDTYLGLVRAGKKFAVVATSAKRMDVGLKLKGVEATARLAPAGSWNSMVTHRVQLFGGAEIDDELIAWLRAAYDAAA